jgi:hypothetical protein
MENEQQKPKPDSKNPNKQQNPQTGNKNPNVAIETWSSKIFARTHSNQTSDKEIERVRQSEMEMSEAKREKCGSGRSGNEEGRGEMRDRIN